MITYTLGSYVRHVRKALVGAVGMAGALLADGLVPKPYDHWVSIGIAVATVLTHYSVPNGASPGRVPALDAPDDVDDLDGADVYEPIGASAEDLDDVSPPPSAAPVQLDDLREELLADLLTALGAARTVGQTGRNAPVRSYEAVDGLP